MGCTRMFFGLAVMAVLGAGCRAVPPRQFTGPTETYYARCNLKVLKGNKIDYINWQSAPTFIPAGRRLDGVTRGGWAKLTDPETGEEYLLDAYAAPFLEKFLSPEPVDLDGLSDEARQNVAEAVARLGMTKEEVYLAMGPPYRVGGNAVTTQMSREQILSRNLWVYARRRMGKNIGVEFGPDGKVIRTQGIWR